MAAALPIIMIAGTAYSVYQGMEAAQLQKQAAADAERIGRENAAIIEQEGQEEIRRTKDAQEQQAGSARAAINASSLGGETTGNYLNDLTDSHVEAISWLEKSSTNRQKIAINTGMYTAQTARAGASQTMAGVAGNISTGAGNLYTAGGNANWW